MNIQDNSRQSSNQNLTQNLSQTGNNVVNNNSQQQSTSDDKKNQMDGVKIKIDNQSPPAELDRKVPRTMPLYGTDAILAATGIDKKGHLHIDKNTEIDLSNPELKVIKHVNGKKVIMDIHDYLKVPKDDDDMESTALSPEAYLGYDTEETNSDSNEGIEDTVDVDQDVQNDEVGNSDSMRDVSSGEGGTLEGVRVTSQKNDLNNMTDRGTSPSKSGTLKTEKSIKEVSDNNFSNKDEKQTESLIDKFNKSNKQDDKNSKTLDMGTEIVDNVNSRKEESVHLEIDPTDVNIYLPDQENQGVQITDVDIDDNKINKSDMDMTNDASNISGNGNDMTNNENEIKNKTFENNNLDVQVAESATVEPKSVTHLESSKNDDSIYEVKKIGDIDSIVDSQGVEQTTNSYTETSQNIQNTQNESSEQNVQTSQGKSSSDMPTVEEIKKKLHHDRDHVPGVTEDFGEPRWEDDPDGVPTAQPTEIKDPSLSRFKILIIEDNSDVRYQYEFMLKREGFTVLTAKNGEEGIVTAIKERPQLILLDILMPEVDGWEVLQTLREYTSTYKPHIMILSNLGAPEDIEKAYKLGADMFVIKADTTINDVVAKVRNILLKHGETKVFIIPLDLKSIEVKDFLDNSLPELRTGKCPECGGPLGLKLIPEFHQDKATGKVIQEYITRIVCLRCGKEWV